MTRAPADETRTAIRTCPLCEAGCGLEITLKGDDVVRIRGDRDDVFSHGFICPKGSTLKQLREDPDRVRVPLVKRDGQFVEVSYDEAFTEIAERLLPILEEHGRDSCAVYIGNPTAHNLGAQLYGRFVIRALGTRNLFSASTVDQRPKEISSALMFGGGLTVPVPDVDRTQYLLVLGANPYASNGSLATAPDWPGRIEAMQARGGWLVVVDPRRSRTAEQANEHLFIRPGTDAFFLMALVQTMFADGLVTAGRLGPLHEWLTGLDEVERLSKTFTPEAVAPITGIAADATRRIAHELCDASTACVYGRIGTCTQEFGTLASWLVDVLNICTGNLDRAGGAMFTKAAAGASNTRGTPRVGRGLRLGRRTSRVRGLPETMGELPAVVLAEEIETAGPDQIRALVTMAGNPALSIPNGGGRLDRALDTLEFMVSVDIYVNETTRHADVILPVPDPLSKSHYDLALLQLAIRNVANYSPPVIPLTDGQPDEWEVLARLALVLQGMGPDADPAAIDDLAIRSLVEHAVADPTSPVHDRPVADVLDELAPRTGPERILDLMLRTGPYDLTLDDLLANPHGIDLGPLEPRLPDVLRTPSGLIELAPEPLVADVTRLEAALDDDAAAARSEFVLVGRRDLRSNNSWMHNVSVLVKGKPRCTLHLHPSDATRLGLVDGAAANVRSRSGAVTVPVEVTDAIMPGVVSIPHGWGHDLEGVQLSVAATVAAGVNSNLLADETRFDPVSGNAVLNGIPVEVTAQ
ncbi:MAG TPA: molybdopterin oxidoreductase family protein [Acidimicrobiales bacterium]|nr:molybdopterin oxidoreductase family protein [Acidimicrobiales bacterium]